MRSLILLCVYFLCADLQAQNTIQVAFTIPEKDFIPEGIAYDSAHQHFYVGSIHKNKIVRVDRNGRVTEFVKPFQDSIGQVLGMKVDSRNGYLWACSNEGEGLVGGNAYVHQYDIRSGKLIQKYTYSKSGETHLFNDLTLAGGNVYVSDSEGRSIFKIDTKTKTVDLFVKDDILIYVNGITTIPGTNDIVAVSARGFKRINTETKQITGIPFEGFAIAGIDGFYYYKDSFIGIQNVFFPEAISRFYLNEQRELVTKAEVLVANHEKFEIPTTGVIVGNELYFIGNSFLNYYDKGKLEDPSKLRDVIVFRLKLD